MTTDGSYPVVEGFSLGRLPVYAAAVRRVKAGTGRGRILIVGDSTCLGIGADHQTCWPTVAAARMATRGLPTTTAGFFGAGDFNGTNSNTHTGLSFAAGWASSSTGAANTLGGACFRNTTTTGAIAYNPPVNVDTFKIYYPVNTTPFGTISYAIDGGAATNINENAAIALGQATISAGSPGSHTLAIARVSGSAEFCAMWAYDSTVPAMDVLNAGWAGSDVSNWGQVTNPWSSLNMITALAPDLVILNPLINDANAGTTEALYKSRLQTLVDTSRAVGADLIMATGQPYTQATVNFQRQRSYVRWARDVAMLNRIPFINQFYWRVGGYDALNQKGWMFDTFHPNATGYAPWGTFMGDLLMRAA